MDCVEASQSKSPGGYGSRTFGARSFDFGEYACAEDLGYTMSMAKTVVLAGHCGPDSSYLKMIIKKALGDVHIVAADDSHELSRALEKHAPDLILLNRELGYGFDPATGVETVRLLHRSRPELKTMVVTNYPEVQRDAEAAGALPGFGKNELGSHRVLQVLRDAVGITGAPAAAGHMKHGRDAHAT
jgi:CheY-like chemotaxis protein